MATASATTAASSSKAARLLATNLRQLGDYLELASVPDAELEKRADNISKWSVAQQIDHVVVADDYMINAILGAISSPPPNVDARPIPMGRIVLLTGFIPRGKGKAPQGVYPKGVSHEEIRAGLKKTMTRVKELEASLPQIERSIGRVPHPVLGFFTGTEWLRFMDTHHHHHVKIIRDIQKNA